MRNEFQGAPAEFMTYALYEAGLLSDNFSDECEKSIATDMSFDMVEGYMVDHGTAVAMEEAWAREEALLRGW